MSSTPMRGRLLPQVPLLMASLTLGASACAEGFDDPVDTEVGDAPRCAEVARWSSDWVEWEAAVVRALDAARATKRSCGDAVQRRHRALRIEPTLTCAARKQALMLADRGEITRRGSGGADFVTRLDRSHYPGVPVAELLAIDVDDPVAVVERWLEDEASCTAVLGPSDASSDPGPYADEVGVGLVRDGPAERPHWVVALGRSR